MTDSLPQPPSESPSGSRPRLLIIGASARAAAFSALRAGYEPVCIDLFGDADLQAAAQVTAVAGDLQPFLDCAAQYPGVPLLYAGGFENHPDWLEALAAGRVLLGNPPEVVRRIRDPFQVVAALRASRLPCLDVRPADAPPPSDGTWLLKPLHSGGGLGIVPWTPAAADSPTLARPHYFQQRASGTSYSVVFVARESLGDVRFVGITEQLIGEPRCQASGFAWCGNIGPASLPIEVESVMRRLGNFLKWKFGLRGLFGIDFIVSPAGEVCLTEINPRYPASAEILEFATGLNLVLEHCLCFDDGPAAPPAVDWTPLPSRVLGKAILYARAMAAVQFRWTFSPEGYASWPRFADVPAAGTVIRPGAPICTLMATGADLQTCRENLWEAVSGVLGEPQTP